ncbi:MAG: hypothetical protein MJA84_08965 [Firmicutes bacterium]|nr:hypothetical protein [Bacillota bacterium]
METLADIVGKIIWPTTIIVVVALLRKPLSDLVPTLKKFKYKDLELEFEKEASKILADTERDIPEPDEPPIVCESEREYGVDPKDQVCFKRLELEPSEKILVIWKKVEKEIRRLASSDNLTSKSVGALIKNLTVNKVIDKEVMQSLLNLASLRNRVAHSDSELISENAANAYNEAASRVLSHLKSIESNKASEGISSSSASRNPSS